MTSFTHLHVHSEYSLLDGLPTIPGLVARAKELGFDALALTDHGAMYGAIYFYKECLSFDIKPIIGCEIYFAPRSRFDKEPKIDSESFHLVLLAKNYQGYKNLMKISTIAHLEGFYYRPRVDRDVLRDYHDGLLALSGCLSGEVAKLVIKGDFKAAKERALEIEEIFGKGNFFLEIQNHQYSRFLSNYPAGSPIHDQLIQQSQEEEKAILGILKLSEETGIPVVATNDVHYVEESDAYAQDVLLSIQTGKTIADPNRLRMIDSPTFYLKSEEEMNDLFPQHPRFLKNTQKIVNEINLEIPIGQYDFPQFEVPKNLTPNEYLSQLVWDGINQKLRKIEKEVKGRLDYELSIIQEKNYSTYFLVVSDFVNWAHSQRIISTTRGSAAGSLVSYALGITNINPLEFNLPFERFLNPERPSLPDIDVDFADNRRDEVLDYVRKKYGEEKVAQIATFGTMMARAAVRDVARVLGWPYGKADRVAKMIPFGSQGFPMTITQAIKINPDLQKLYKEDEEVKSLLDKAREIEGNARHASVHAAGVVIAPKNLTEYTPLARETNGDSIITQFDMYSIEDAGLPKMDFLGVRNLSILGLAVEIVEKEQGLKIDLSEIPFNDKKAFAMLAQGETVGLFQLGGSGMTRYLKELKPTNIFDIMAMISLFRPGPMNSIPEFIARKHDSSKIKYFDPRMKDYLRESYGLIVYQDDVLITAIKIAGYTWEEADKFRKAMGKKIPSEMAKQREKFIGGCIKNGMAEEKAIELFKLIEPFSAYGFNKAHAASYAVIAYQTAFMKANYPVEFMTAVMTAEVGDAAKLSAAVSECKKLGIVILPPDINFSDAGFKIEKIKGKDKAIRFGLSAIKNVGRAAIEEILKAREQGPFSALSDLARRVSLRAVNKKTIESLIKAGALDSFGERENLLSSLEKVKGQTFSPSKIASGQTKLFDIEEVKLAIDPFPVEKTDESENETQKLAWERELLGFYLTKHPLEDYLPKMQKLKVTKIAELKGKAEGQEQILTAGFLSSLRRTFTKAKNEEMAFGSLEDDSTSCDIVFFPRVYLQSKELIAKEKAILVLGKVVQRDEDISIICERVYDLDTVSEDEVLTPIKIKERAIEVTLPPEFNKDYLTKISTILKNYPGNSKVFVVMSLGEGEIKKVPLRYGVTVNHSLTKTLEEIGCAVVSS